MNSKESLDLLYSDAVNGNMDENHEYINREEIEREYFEIKHDLDRLESLEAKFDAYYELHKQLEEGYDNIAVENDKLIQENRNLKKVIDFIKENFEIELHYDEECDEYTICFMEYDEYLEEISTGITKYVNKEEYDLLKEYLGND